MKVYSLHQLNVKMHFHHLRWHLVKICVYFRSIQKKNQKKKQKQKCQIIFRKKIPLCLKTNFLIESLTRFKSIGLKLHNVTAGNGIS